MRKIGEADDGAAADSKRVLEQTLDIRNDLQGG